MVCCYACFDFDEEGEEKMEKYSGLVMLVLFMLTPIFTCGGIFAFIHIVILDDELWTWNVVLGVWNVGICLLAGLNIALTFHHEMRSKIPKQTGKVSDSKVEERASNAMRGYLRPFVEYSFKLFGIYFTNMNEITLEVWHEELGWISFVLATLPAILIGYVVYYNINPEFMLRCGLDYNPNDHLLCPVTADGARDPDGTCCEVYKKPGTAFSFLATLATTLLAAYGVVRYSTLFFLGSCPTVKTITQDDVTSRVQSLEQNLALVLGDKWTEKKTLDDLEDGPAGTTKVGGGPMESGDSDI